VKREFILVVEAIDPPHALVLLAWGNGIAGAGTGNPRRILSNWYRVRGQFAEGTLQVSFGGTTVTYRLQPDGTLAMTVHSRDRVSHVTMTRAPE